MKRNLTRITGILGTLMTITPFSIDMYLPAFSRIAEDFGTTVPRVGFSMSSYFIGLSLGQILYGPFLDRFGRKPPLYFGLGLYLLMTVLCMLAPNIELLIVARFFQAVGGCAASVSVVAMIRDFYPATDRAKIFSRMMLILSVSPFFAPSIGSLIVGAAGWRSVFGVLGGIAATVLLLVRFALPESHAADSKISLRPGAIAKEYVSIFRHPHFFRYAVSGALSFAGLFSYLAASPAIFMGVHGLSEREFGLVFAVLSVGMIGGSQVSVLLGKRYAPAAIFRTALLGQLAFATIFLVAALGPGMGFIPEAAILFGLISCVGLTYPNAAALALEPFAKNAGSAAAMLGFLQMGIGGLGSAVFGMIPLEPSSAVGIVFVATVGLSAALFFGRRAK